MKGLEKFKKEIKAEVDKVKDDKKKKLIQAEANEIIKHIESVCDEEYDELLAQDHKSFKRMWQFVSKNARAYAINNCAMVKDSTVFGWIDEYVGLDDEKEAKEEEKIEKQMNNAKAKATAQKLAVAKTKAKEAVAKTTAVQASVFDLF